MRLKTRIFCLFMMLALIEVGCSPISTVRRRAQFDLDCQEKEIQVAEIAPSIYGAKGCGRRASYLAGCGLGCGAIKESESGTKGKE